MNRPTTKFETELEARPSDIDMFRHVHSSRYLDYVLAARFDQMGRCYGVSMADFEKLGLGWVVRTAHVEYKRPLGLGERFIVRTWVDSIERTDVVVHFEIDRKTPSKRACDGWCRYTMVNLGTGRAEVIPDWIIEKYSI